MFTFPSTDTAGAPKQLTHATVTAITAESVRVTTVRQQDLEIVFARNLQELGLVVGQSVMIYYLAAVNPSSPVMGLTIYPTSLTAAEFTQIFIANSKALAYME